MVSFLRLTFCFLFIIPAVQCWTPGKFHKAASHHISGDEVDTVSSTIRQDVNQDRRHFLVSTLAKSSVAIGTAVPSTLMNPLIVNAKQEEVSTPSNTSSSLERTKPNFTQSEIASFLHPIPTFAIVDPKGVPFMVVGEDAKLSAYFFTSYNEANRILNLAKTSADKTISNLIKEENEKRKMKGLKTMTKEDIEEEVGVNPWIGARISSLPLDFSVSLASRGKVAGSYFRIAPSEDDVQDALNVDTSVKDLAEGKVPLFYIDDFEISEEGESENRIPLYFQKSQLLEAYKKSSQGKSSKKDEPVVKVTELFSILTQMAGTNEIDNDVKKLTLIPPRDSSEKAKLCEKKGGKESPYKIGERIVVL